MNSTLSKKIIAFSNWNLWTFPLQFLLSFAASVYVVRTLGLTLYGRWHIILTSISFFALLSDAGLASCVTKFYPELATEKERQLRAIFFLFLGRILLLILIAASIPLWPDSFSLSETAEDLSPWIIANIAIQIIASIIVGWHLARFDNKPIQIATALQNFIFPLLLLLFFRPHLTTLLLLYSAANLIKTFYLMTTVRLNPRKFFQAVFTTKLPTGFWQRTWLQIQSKVISQILRFTFDLGLLILVFSGPEYLEQVAWLVLANRILAHALSFSAFPLNQIQEPLFAHLFTRKNDHALIQNNYNSLTKYYTVFTVPFLTILIGFGHLVIPVIYGKSFSPSSPHLIILSVTMMFCTYWSLAPKMLIAFEQHKFYDITSFLFTVLLGGIFSLAWTYHKFQLAFLSLCVLRILFHGALSFYVIRKYQIQREWDWLGKTLMCNLLWLTPLFIKEIHLMGIGILLLGLSVLFLWIHKKMGILTDKDKSNFAQLSLPFKDGILACL